jgi:hypothetical protein
LFNDLQSNEIEGFIQSFLVSNNVNIEDLDAVILGNNGDAQFDGYYNVANTIFSKTPQVHYKHLSGEYNTASSFGFWVASKILKTQQIPQTVKMNNITKESYTYVLLYNQYRGKDHSLILLKKC